MLQFDNKELTSKSLSQCKRINGIKCVRYYNNRLHYSFVWKCMLVDWKMTGWMASGKHKSTITSRITSVYSIIYRCMSFSHPKFLILIGGIKSKNLQSYDSPKLAQMCTSIKLQTTDFFKLFNTFVACLICFTISMSG